MPPVAHKALAAGDDLDTNPALQDACAYEDAELDMDPALRACVQLALAGPRLVPPPEPAAAAPLTVSAPEASGRALPPPRIDARAKYSFGLTHRDGPVGAGYIGGACYDPPVAVTPPTRRDGQ